MSDALNRGLDVLEVLARRGDSRVAELMAELSISRATAHRVLGTLESRGYVEHARAEHVWRLGPAVAELAAELDSTSVMQLAAPALADLRESTRETVNLAVLQRNLLVYVASFDGAHALRHTATIGATASMHSTAVGKAILMTFPEQEWARFLPPEPFPALTPNTRRTMSELVGDVERARRRGWTLDDEEAEMSGVCVGAPITGREGKAVAAISVCSVSGRLPSDAREPVGRAVAKWCHEISQQLAAK